MANQATFGLSLLVAHINKKCSHFYHFIFLEGFIRQYVTTNIFFHITDDSCLDSVSLYINNNFISAIKLM